MKHVGEEPFERKGQGSIWDTFRCLFICDEKYRLWIHNSWGSCSDIHHLIKALLKVTILQYTQEILEHKLQTNNWSNLYTYITKQLKVKIPVIFIYWFITCHLIFLDFKLSLCSECSMFFSGWFTVVWSLYAKVSEILSVPAS